MRPTTVIILGIILLGIIAGIYTFRHSVNPVERFEADKESMDPQQMLSRVKRLLDKIDNPELIGHMLNMVDKDPGQLARMQLNLTS